MKILGLTGSIAMGKTEVGRMFAAEGIPVFDADQAVHDVLGRGGKAVDRVAALFPGVKTDDAIDRKALGDQVFGRPDQLRRLVSILHPMVRVERKRFTRLARVRGEALIVYDIPLLFETGGDRACDAVAVVTAPARVQRRRLMRRPGMTEAKLEAILKEQMPDREKRRRADFIIHTGQSKAETRREVRAVIRAMKRKKGQHARSRL